MNEKERQAAVEALVRAEVSAFTARLAEKVGQWVAEEVEGIADRVTVGVHDLPATDHREGDLMGHAEAAEYLGVVRSAIRSLSLNNPEFPEPLARLRCGPVWRAADIRLFARVSRRGVGRPKKEKVA